MAQPSPIRATLLKRLPVLVALAIAKIMGFPPLADAAPIAPEIVRQFQGVTEADIVALGINLTPPDTMGAVGRDHVVEFVNGALAIYGKDGARQSIKRDSQFWLDAGIAAATLIPGVSDPRITFDPTVNRWFATEITKSSTSNRVLIARSDSADPTGTWKATSYIASGTFFADYDTLGVDATNIYVGTNNFNRSTGQLVSLGMAILPKADILAVTPSLANGVLYLDTSGALGISPRGVTNYSSNPGHGVLMAVDAFDWQTTDRITVFGSGSTTSLSAMTQITTTYDVATGPINPTQPGGTAIDVVDHRYTGQITQVGDNIYMTNTVIHAGHDAVHWLVVSELTNAIVGEGLIADPSFDYLQPSLGVNADGTFLLAFNRVGATAGSGNIGIWGAIGTTQPGSITVANPFLIRSGTVSNFTGPSFDTGTAKRWGDYSATVADPAINGLFWSFQEVPLSANQWSTQVTAIYVPEPSTWVMGLVAMATAAWGRVRRRRGGE